MSICKKNLQEKVIQPILKSFDLWSPEAENLLLAVCAQESHLGKYLVQDNGPALGIYQMEPATYEDIVINVICKSTRNWLYKIYTYFGRMELLGNTEKLIYDLRYATLFARLQFWRYKAPIPAVEDLDGLFDYWKKYYNRNAEKGNKQQFIENYEKYVLKV